MNKYLKIFISLTILLTYNIIGYAQESTPEKPDSLKYDITKPIIIENQLNTQNDIYLKLPRQNSVEKFQPQFSPFDRFSLSPQYTRSRGIMPPIHWSGASSDFIFSKSKTAIGTMIPTPRLFLYSAATLGLVETPFFGKADYYALSAGANYSVSSALNLGLRGSYNSNFDILPIWNVGIDANYMMNTNLSFDGPVTYIQTGNNVFNVNQAALILTCIVDILPLSSKPLL